MREWQESDGVSLLSRAPAYDGRHEIFSAPAARWIIQTNRETPGQHFDLTRIAMLSWPTPPTSILQPRKPQKPFFPEPLTFVWRIGPTANGSPRCEPSLLQILDEHGCPYAPTEIITNTRVMSAKFARFPRSNPTFRLVGFGPAGKTNLLFDYTLTNHVRTEPKILPVHTIPFDLPIENAVMHVAAISEMPTNPNFPRNPTIGHIDATFTGTTTNPAPKYSIYGIHYRDRHGNILDPAEMCRYETNVIAAGFVEIRSAPPTGPLWSPPDRIPIEFAMPRPKPRAL